eukprot:c25753_g1_i6 orf=130-1398(+)
MIISPSILCWPMAGRMALSLPITIPCLRVRCNGTALPASHSSNARVLILGATGRVGGSTARALSNCCPNLQLVVAGRSREKGEQLLRDIGKQAEFVDVDIDDATALRAILDGVDLVVHAAGPFQCREQCNVLEAAIVSKTAYIDVCDGREYSQRAKGLNEKAKAAGIPAITTAGIFPGISNVMAAELVHLAKDESSGSGLKPEHLRFYYFTAGSGGAGPTILATSFLLLGEEVIAYRKGEKVVRQPYSGPVTVDFGKAVGKRTVYLLNLPEVASAHEILGVPNVSARFGTAPAIWNWAMVAVAKFVPQELLGNRATIDTLVRLSDPLVDLECVNGRKSIGLFTHSNLSICVGVATAAFVRAVLEGSTEPGVWFPEEPGGIAVQARPLLLERASVGTLNFVMNRAPWMVEGDPKEIGFGIYIP